MTLLRRRLLLSLPLLSLAAAKPQSKPQSPGGEVTTTDLVLNCDTALGPVLARAAERFRSVSGVTVRVFPTSPGLLVPQLARKVQNDLLVTQDGIVAQAAAAGLIDGAPVGAWRNRLVVAARKGAAADALRGRIAVCDPTPAADMDGPGILRALQLGERSVVGVLDTDEVLDLVLRGEAEAGLLHASDLAQRPALEVIRPVPERVAPPITYRAAVTRLARRPNPRAFLDFLTSPAGSGALAAQGLETTA
ncbi:substrate-binding domain-containing protein [Methylobacterium sp. WSM2598]|uniref:substrate-binding domain-containing protein n=1 Tax=Methylobacterium sp. WSM2598 TaxID=398261 RepID=UPI00036D3717|nr:substrate-binding domain-containing protein [Methylobacterium sp. WSM2598]